MKQRTRAERSIAVFKWVLVLIVVTIIGLFIQQNMGTFAGPQYFRLNLFRTEVLAWNVRFYDLLLVCAFLGFIGGIALMLKPFLKLRRELTAERAARAERTVLSAANAAPDSKLAT